MNCMIIDWNIIWHKNYNSLLLINIDKYGSWIVIVYNLLQIIHVYNVYGHWLGTFPTHSQPWLSTWLKPPGGHCIIVGGLGSTPMLWLSWNWWLQFHLLPGKMSRPNISGWFNHKGFWVRGSHLIVTLQDVLQRLLIPQRQSSGCLGRVSCSWNEQPNINHIAEMKHEHIVTLVTLE